jgi:hypothetical protein
MAKVTITILVCVSCFLTNFFFVIHDGKAYSFLQEEADLKGAKYSLFNNRGLLTQRCGDGPLSSSVFALLKRNCRRK